MRTSTIEHPTSNIERTTIAVGKELFARARRVASSDGLLDRTMMRWTMADERLKAQLFRLVDVLPVLKDSGSINRHLREYLASVADRLPWVAREGLSFIGESGPLANMLAFTTKFGATRMARRFIAAADENEALAAARKLRRQHLTFTIDLLGEAVLSASEAKAYQAYYLRLIDELAAEAAGWQEIPLIDRDHLGPVPKVNVSVKLSSLFSQFDPIDPEGTSRAVRERLRPILRLAKARGVFINVDMEQYSYKETTLRIFRDVLEEDEFRGWGDVGIAIQAYLQSSGEDLRRLAEWARARGTSVSVRLVKGAYWDYENIIAQQNNWPLPVYPTKPQTDANYEAQTAFLMKNYQVLRPAIASHNIRSIAAALALAREHGVPGKAFEFQLLYGMGEEIKAALVSMGERVRVYAPVGKLLPGMAYLVRRLLENTSNESFLRAGFIEHVSEETLLMNPLRKINHELTPMGTNKKPIRDHSCSFVVTPFANEPLTDFSRVEAREAMKNALERVRGELGRSYSLVIGGQRVKSGEWISSVDPSVPSRVVGRVAAARVADADRAVAVAKAAFAAWRDTAVEVRAGVLFRLAEVLRRRRFEMAAWQVFEVGKPWREADADVAEAIDYCEYYGREALRLGQGWNHNVPGEENRNMYEPRGVAVTIAPWNFPLAILLGMSVSALVTGNAVIMKPAEQSSVIGCKLMEAFEEAGAPAGTVNLLTGVGETIGPALVGHPDVAMIAFTGSRAVGLAIQREAAQVTNGQEHLKRVITELGGKNAIIIDDDADLDEAVHGVVASAFGYAGQKCSACSRVIVPETIHDAFVSRLVEATASLKQGPAEDPSNFLGPVVDREAYERIVRTIQNAPAPAKRVYPNGPLEMFDGQSGYFVPPTILVDVPPDSTLAQEEIFGPVLSVIRSKGMEESIAIANGTRYALTGGLFSRSPAMIDRVRREFRVGNLYINRKITGATVLRQPFGGFKMSGTGPKAGGPDYLVQFTHQRTITENTMRRGFAPPESDDQGLGM